MKPLLIIFAALAIALLILFSGCVTYDECDLNKDGKVSEIERQECAQGDGNTGGKCGDGICGPVEKERGICPGDCEGIKPGAGSSTDADGFLWGAEFALGQGMAADVINSTLKIKYIKVRFQQQFFSEDGVNFSNFMCHPSQADCKEKIDLDKEVQKIKENGWSLIPMLSHNTESQTFVSSDIEGYANYADWFLSRYQKDANIKYVELINHPGESWKGTKEQLLEANNKAYEEIKSKYPDVLVSTPGFEYWLDGEETAMTNQDEYLKKTLEYVDYFLDKENGAKFDIWSFHGYPAKTASGGEFINYPPTKTAIFNKYAHIGGIAEIRERLNINGWQNVPIMDFENGTGGAIVRPMGTVSDSEDRLNAAFEIQSLLLSKMQLMASNGNYWPYGMVALKIYPKLNKGEFRLGSLKSDGSATKMVKSVALLWSKLSEYSYDSHISGEFDNEDEAWIEKFSSGSKDLYIFFKPFEYHAGQTIEFDGKIADYALALDRAPASITLTDTEGNTSSITPDTTIAIEAENAPNFLEIKYE
ncbi:MAG: hypothetical protein HYW05_05290 [Candidatus Diapherotrites archaeon]|nr:hypothetical protein [Candidatus Diapherotrites archaeon]